MNHEITLTVLKVCQHQHGDCLLISSTDRSMIVPMSCDGNVVVVVVSGAAVVVVVSNADVVVGVVVVVSGAAVVVVVPGATVVVAWHCPSP